MLALHRLEESLLHGDVNGNWKAFNLLHWQFQLIQVHGSEFVELAYQLAHHVCDESGVRKMQVVEYAATNGGLRPLVEAITWVVLDDRGDQCVMHAAFIAHVALRCSITADDIVAMWDDNKCWSSFEKLCEQQGSQLVFGYSSVYDTFLFATDGIWILSFMCDWGDAHGSAKHTLVWLPALGWLACSFGVSRFQPHEVKKALKETLEVANSYKISPNFEKSTPK